MGNCSQIFSLLAAGIITLVPLVVTALLLVYLVIRTLRVKDDDRAMKITPLEALRRRYARGEITSDEFEQAKSKLTAGETGGFSSISAGRQQDRSAGSDSPGR